jgi:hypothetical protein
MRCRGVTRGTNAALAVSMRTLPTIPTPALFHVTGGCHKGQQPQQQSPTDDGTPRVQVQVATGAQGGQAIQQALSGGSPAASAVPTAG